ncbi:MAG: acyl carrier protein phosphodiesterase [bacterium]|jgi:acyl carrier protein phosphodiesterase
MNYLAHIFLSEPTPENQIGNLLGDFVKKHEDKNYSDAIQKGILRHRKIDRFTDYHPIFQTSRTRICSENRRYAGILIDIFYDHFLAKNWHLFSVISLEQFSDEFYQALQKNYSILPTRLQQMMPFFIKENWLLSYKHQSNIERTLLRFSKRIKRENSLSKSMDDLNLHFSELEHDFLELFPLLQKYTQTLFFE